MPQLSNSLLDITVRPEIVMSRGEGMYLFDSQGRRYLDFIGGWAVNSFGHSPDFLSKTLHEQAKTLINASPSFYSEGMLAFADKITAISGMDRVFCSSTGAEANENAIKIARKFGATKKEGAYKIAAFKGGFHGRTITAMALSGKDKWKDLYEPKTPGFVHFELNNFDDIDAMPWDELCAVMLEPVQGEGGVYPADPVWLHALAERCKKENTLLIFDEVQTGMGRLGEFFASHLYDITPDIMTLGKGVGAGFPLAATLTTESLNIMEPGELGGTYNGNSLAMAVGIAVVEELQKPAFIANVKDREAQLRSELTPLLESLGCSAIRGHGLLLAFDLPQARAGELVQNCLEKGLILNAPQPASIRLMPPLICSEEHVLEMLDVLEPELTKLLT